MKSDDAAGVPTIEERDLTLVATLVTVIIVAGAIFLVNTASTEFTTARYSTTPQTVNNVPVMTTPVQVTERALAQ